MIFFSLSALYVSPSHFSLLKPVIDETFQAVLEVQIEILAAVGDDDGITRWLD